MPSQLSRGRVTVVLGIGMILAVSSRELWGQTSDDVLTEIKLLKRIVTEQDPRITDLENALKGQSCLMQDEPGGEVGFSRKMS
jgi:hypothetical protein